MLNGISAVVSEDCATQRNRVRDQWQDELQVPSVSSSFAQSLGYDGIADAIRHHNSRPAYLLKRSEQTLTAMYLERCRSHGLRLTISQLLLLCAVDAEPRAHQAIAARMTGMDTPTTALVIRGLIKRGLAEREGSSEDRRRLILAVTPAGRSAKSRALQQLAAAVKLFLEPVDAADQRHLLDLLLRVSTNPDSLAPPLCDRDGERIPAPDFLPEEVLPAYLISRCLQVAVSLVRPAVSAFGLSISQYVALTILSTFEECNLATLSRALGAERSSLSHILSALERRSLIRVRRRGQPPQSLAITPTQAGFEHLLLARPAAEDANARILSSLDRTEADDFNRILPEVLKFHGKLMTVEPGARSRRT